jgi:D-arabinose 1-dehydrogenase-like Zn-dependent alcohol dehydrogenase
VVEDIPKPVPGPGQIVVRVEGSGFCHSDIHVIYGEYGSFRGCRSSSDSAVSGKTASSCCVCSGAAIRFEVLYEATLCGTIKELREVIALAETGQLAPIPIERSPLDRINDVYARLKHGDIRGRAVITPAL